MGPLEGIRVVEFAGIGPGPLAAMLLADLGASVIRVDRPSTGSFPHRSQVHHGRAVLPVDLKSEEGKAAALRLVEAADVVLEGLRPGVMERLGLGPETCLERNPGLVYGRMTGWGQEGPLSQRAGHDMNYISLNGALHSFARKGEKPVPPINMMGDFGGGTMFLVSGVLAALVERGRSGRGQVVDAAMVDGSAFLMSNIYEGFSAGAWNDEPGTNLLDTGSPWYDVYTCADGRYVSVGAIEPQFYAELLKGLGLEGADLPDQWDRNGWPVLRERFTEIFATKTRDEWAEIFEGVDACVMPVLSLTEAPKHPHVKARGTVALEDGTTYSGAAPRFSRTPSTSTRDPKYAQPDLNDTLAAWNVPPNEVGA